MLSQNIVWTDNVKNLYIPFGSMGLCFHMQPDIPPRRQHPMERSKVYPFHFEHAFLNKNESFITLSAPIWSKRRWERSGRLFHSQLANCHILLTQSLVQRTKASCKLIEPNPGLSDRFRRAKRGGSLPPGRSRDKLDCSYVHSLLSNPLNRTMFLVLTVIESEMSPK